MLAATSTTFLSSAPGARKYSARTAGRNAKRKTSLLKTMLRRDALAALGRFPAHAAGRHRARRRLRRRGRVAHARRARTLPPPVAGAVRALCADRVRRD